MHPAKHNHNVLVVVGDLVASRHVRNRGAVQQKLQETLRRLNSVRKPNLLSPYTVTLGDEFQAVMGRPDMLFRDALSILIALHPIGIRFSYGIGRLDTPINTKQAIGMDGPAFHAARDAMHRLKGTRSCFAVSGEDADVLGLVNQSLALVSYVIRRWHQNRLEILLGLYEEVRVQTIAKNLGVTDKAVYKAIDAGGMRALVPLFAEITKALTAAMERR